MTELEKALEGRLYDANNDPEVIAAIQACKELCYAYNQLPPSRTEEKTAMLERILGGMGEGCVITAPAWFDYGSRTTVGKNFYSNHNLVVLDAGTITFGDYVFIGPNCCFTTSGHPIDAERRNRGLEYAYPIRVGDNVWFGANVTVLPGVTIGDNCVIGAGSVVNRDIPSNTVAVGVPCRVLRPISEEDARALRL